LGYKKLRKVKKSFQGFFFVYVYAIMSDIISQTKGLKTKSIRGGDGIG
jgi:hypothetical protein